MEKKEHITSIGGSAVMEGVMMRGPKEIATAVRKPDGEIEIDRRAVSSLVTKYHVNKIPVIRIPAQPVNYIAKYEFRRIINNKYITAIGKFTFREAQQAEMFEKDTYKKYPSVMIKHRAFTLGARDIASDVLFGVMETKELKIINDVEFSGHDIEDQEI